MRTTPATDEIVAPSPSPALDAVDAGRPHRGSLVRVTGLVQGVGFRPTVWRLAQDCGLTGDVRNDSAGVLIRIWGPPSARRCFVAQLRCEAPPLARIDALECRDLDEPEPSSAFRIVPSDRSEVRTGVVPDAATCPDCLAEILDRRERRFGYAFANCTHCGPRLSIVEAIPYDRCNTSMASFDLCPACRREYDDPADRRFHAQPIACPECGPTPWIEAAAAGPDLAETADPLAAARRLLGAGRIVAIKGVGGIHLACDATNSDAVERLRRRKRRFEKPFALMAADLAMVRRYCDTDPASAALLTGPAAPIVLLPANGRERLADAIAPGQNTYGFMLPYSPLHHLLMSGIGAPIVLTSGNRSEEPQCIGNEEARRKLGDIADALLLHDRDIVNRVDDSVVRVIADRPAVLRRARGYAPASLTLPRAFAAAPDVLAMGGELKSTFCLLRGGEAILSQHLGDLENAATNAAFGDTLALYLALFGHEPKILAIDAHPDYLASKLGRKRAATAGRMPVVVQHHHAHIAACLADNGIAPGEPGVLGVALDGTGFGDDGTFWGGEFLFGDYASYRRVASFAEVGLPGGARAIREPWRMGVAHLLSAGLRPRFERAPQREPFLAHVAGKPLATLERMLASGFNSPATSSCGRLFDAVAAVIGLRQTVSYEGQAAIELEASVEPAAMHDGRAYPFSIDHNGAPPRLGFGPMWRALLEDLDAGVPRGVIAARFHAGLAQAIVEMVDFLTRELGDPWSGRIALSGGVFQNACLTQALVGRLEAGGREVLRHRRVPANDGGLALGQAVVAAARSIAGRRNRTGRERTACA